MRDDLSPNARALVCAVGDADEPTDADVDRVYAALMSRIAATGAGVAAGVSVVAAVKPVAAAGSTAIGAGSIPVSAAAGTTALAVKVVAALSIAGVVAAGVTAAVRPLAARSASSVSQPDGTRTVVSASRGHAPNAQAPASPVLAAAPAVQAAPPSVAGTTAIAGAAETATPSARTSLATGQTAQPAVERTVGSLSSMQAGAGVAAAPDRESSGLDAEVALLQRAREALQAGDPARSLALLEEHARRFPDGALAEDRAAERVFTLCAMGSVAQARLEGALFVTDHPQSPHAESVRNACGHAAGASDGR